MPDPLPSRCSFGSVKDSDVGLLDMSDPEKPLGIDFPVKLSRVKLVFSIGVLLLPSRVRLVDPREVA